MLHTLEMQSLCSVICEELRGLCIRLADGCLSESEFVGRILQIEEGRVFKNGLILIASNTSDDWTHFTIRARKEREICLAFEFNPNSGEFRDASDASDIR